MKRCLGIIGVVFAVLTLCEFGQAVQAIPEGGVGDIPANGAVVNNPGAEPISEVVPQNRKVFPDKQAISLDEEIKEAEERLQGLRKVKTKKAGLLKRSTKLQAGDESLTTNESDGESDADIFSSVVSRCLNDVFVPVYGSAVESILTDECREGGVNKAYEYAADLYQRGANSSCGHFLGKVKGKQDAEYKYRHKSLLLRNEFAKVSACERSQQAAANKFFASLPNCLDQRFAHQLFLAGKMCGDSNLPIDFYTKPYEKVCMQAKKSENACAGEAVLATIRYAKPALEHNGPISPGAPVGRRAPSSPGKLK